MWKATKNVDQGKISTYNDRPWELENNLLFIQHSDELRTQSLRFKIGILALKEAIHLIRVHRSINALHQHPVPQWFSLFLQTKLKLPWISSGSGWGRTRWRWSKDCEICLMSWERCHCGGSFQASCSYCPCDEPHDGVWEKRGVGRTGCVIVLQKKKEVKLFTGQCNFLSKPVQN